MDDIGASRLGAAISYLLGRENWSEIVPIRQFPMSAFLDSHVRSHCGALGNSGFPVAEKPCWLNRSLQHSSNLLIR